MAVDEIIAEWLGTLHKTTQTATLGTVRQFCASDLRLKSVTFWNSAAGNHAYIGKYDANLAAFKAAALYLMAGKFLSFEDVDLYEFGCATPAGDAIIRVLGIIQD